MYTSPVIYICIFSCVYSKMSKKRWGTWGHDDREDDNPWKKRKWGDNHEDNYNNSWGNKKINNTKNYNAQQQNFDFKLHSNNHLISPHVSMLENNYLINNFYNMQQDGVFDSFFRLVQKDLHRTKKIRIYIVFNAFVKDMSKVCFMISFS